MTTRLQEFNGRHAENVRNYEGTLKEKHGWNVRANYYNRKLAKLGNDRRAAAIHSTMQKQLSVGLRGLAEKDRLEWSDEYLIVEFADIFPPDVVERAAAALEKARAYQATL